MKGHKKSASVVRGDRVWASCECNGWEASVPKSPPGQSDDLRQLAEQHMDHVLKDGR